jgi:hypothetical protein
MAIFFMSNFSKAKSAIFCISLIAIGLYVEKSSCVTSLPWVSFLTVPTNAVIPPQASSSTKS